MRFLKSWHKQLYESANNFQTIQNHSPTPNLTRQQFERVFSASNKLLDVMEEVISEETSVTNEIYLVNMHRVKHVDFKCDRTTPLGNPFNTGDPSLRDEVCDKYHAYFYQCLNPDLAPPGFLEQLDEMQKAHKERDITIGCWCKPLRCHCETVRDWILNTQ